MPVTTTRLCGETVSIVESGMQMKKRSTGPALGHTVKRFAQKPKLFLAGLLLETERQPDRTELDRLPAATLCSILPGARHTCFLLTLAAPCTECETEVPIVFQRLARRQSIHKKAGV